MKKSFITRFCILGILSIILASCSNNDDSTSPTEDDMPPINDNFIRAADISFLPEIESTNTVFYHNNAVENPLITLKNAGCNTIRLRIWKNPATNHSGLTEVKALAQRVKQAGMKVWLTVHYSDTWADPGNQTKPNEWNSLLFSELKNNVTQYTSTILSEIQPDIIQIGNEINDGFLFPEGKLSTNENQCKELLQAAATVIRSQAPNAKIMLHYAGITGSDWFFSKVSTIDYDYIGISYYPIWHGKNLTTLQNTLTSLSTTYNKKILIAETAYPFTLNWNDWTNNIIGLQNQLIPEYPASPLGQKNFLLAIKNIVKQIPNGIGFCYWGTEWIAYRGSEATNGSTWENQALWNFNNQSLPALEAFKKE
jgi:arabinogalactan endo-1,4-beta-galactosidase